MTQFAVLTIPQARRIKKAINRALASINQVTILLVAAGVENLNETLAKSAQPKKPGRKPGRKPKTIAAASPSPAADLT